MARPRKDGKAPRKARHVHLTDAFLKSLKAPDRRTIFYDKNLKGFCLQSEPSGHRSWKLHYRYGGRPRWYHISDVRDLASAKKARAIVEELKAQMVLDPTLDLHAARVALRDAGSFKEHLARYLAHYLGAHPKSYKHTKWTLESRYQGAWGNLKTQAITRADVKRLFAKHTQASPSSANQALAHLGGFFTWAIGEEVITGVNPAQGIKRNKTSSRDRVLDDTEVARVWEALADASPVCARILKVLLLTGQRLNEVTNMRREHLRKVTVKIPEQTRRRVGHGTPVEVEGWMWCLPGEMSKNWDPERKQGDWPGTKNGQSHEIWLPQAVMEIIGIGPNPGGVFTGKLKGHTLGKAVEKAMRKIVKGLEIERAVPHDLRRSHGTAICALGFSRDQMNRVQNHKEGGIGSVYDRHGYRSESWEVQEAVVAHLIGLGEADVNSAEEIAGYLRSPLPT